MIHIYGYYSCGGYKDMYLGNSNNCDHPTYFLPLLPLMKKRNRPEEFLKISELEQLPQIQIISNNNRLGFPEEGNVMFSHGGYVAMYRTLSTGDTCFALRDIPSFTQDEEGRNTPFNVIIMASGADDIYLLDNFAISFIENSKESIRFFGTLFSYDAIINGIKFNLPALYNNIKKIPSKPLSILRPQKQPIVYLMVDSSQSINIAMKEQQLNIKNISCIIDVLGNTISGKLFLKYHTELSNNEDNPILRNRKSALIAPLDSSIESPNNMVEPQTTNVHVNYSRDILELKLTIEMLISEVRNQNIEEKKKSNELDSILKDILLQLSCQEESRLLKIPFIKLIYRNFKMFVILSTVFIVLTLLFMILFK